jgi:hypothetical protein
MRGKVEQELANRIKIMRSLTRLKHAIAADNELNAKLDDAKKKFFQKVQQGQLPAAISVDAFDKVWDA